MMNFAQSYLIFTILVILHSATADELTQKAQEVSDKLETYSQSYASTSGLDMDDLRQAYEESLSWDQEEKEGMRESNPAVQMLHDFVLVPMSKYETLIGDHGDESGFDRKYVARLERTYKQFRPLYHGVVNRSRTKAPALTNAYKALFGVANSPTLTKEILRLGASSYNNHLKQLEMIRNGEDIFAHLKELEKIMSTINVKSVQVFASLIIPRLDQITGTAKELEELSNLYKKTMGEYGIQIFYGGVSLSNVDFSKLYELY